MQKLLIAALIATSFAYADEHEHEREEGILNKAPVVLAGISSVEKFKSSFEAGGASLGSELVGFSSKSVKHEARTSVFSIPENAKLTNSNYDCHFQTDESGKIEGTHCHGAGRSEVRDYTAATGSFTSAEFKQSVENSVALFEGAFGDPKKIHDAKFWRSTVENEPTIQVKYIWKQNSGEINTNYMYCHKHQHGNELEMDCHRQRQPGPFEP